MLVSFDCVFLVVCVYPLDSILERGGFHLKDHKNANEYAAG